MKTEASKKVVIKVSSQEEQENVKNSRRTLKVLQHAATDKENLAGRPVHILKDAKETDKTELRKKVSFMHKAVQTESTITKEDLTSDEPSEEYWRRLAEKRGEALNESLEQIEKLKENVEVLQEENRICKDMLEESKHLVEVLQEMLGESEGDVSTEVAEEATENSSDSK